MTITVQSPAAARAAAGLPGATVDVPMGDRRQAVFFLDALFQRDPGSFIELRLLPSRRQLFFTDSREAAVEAMRAMDEDVYVGVVPRARKAGGKDALIAGSHWLWAECDTETAVVNALDFRCPPPLVVRSSPGKAHCYWPLRDRIPLDLLELANKRLAFHLGADPRATDAARILRVPGTRNHKYGEPHRVSITHVDHGAANLLPSSLVADLPDPSPPKAFPPLPSAMARRQQFGPDAEKDALLAVPARRYIEALSGRGVVRGMVQCPFHRGGQERSPSLHVGGNDECLWFCFGCEEGGDIFTFAAKLWGLDDRRDFPEIKTKLGAVAL